MKPIFLILFCIATMAHAVIVPPAPQFYQFGFEQTEMSNIFHDDTALYAVNYDGIYLWEESQSLWKEINFFGESKNSQGYSSFDESQMAYNENNQVFSFKSGNYIAVHDEARTLIGFPNGFMNGYPCEMAFHQDTLYTSSYNAIIKSSNAGDTWDTVATPIPSPLKLIDMELYNDTLWFTNKNNLYWKAIASSEWDSLFVTTDTYSPKILNFFHINNQLLANIDIMDSATGFHNSPHTISLSHKQITPLVFSITNFDAEKNWWISLHGDLLNLKGVNGTERELYFGTTLENLYLLPLPQPFLKFKNITRFNNRYWVTIHEAGLYTFTDPDAIALTSANTGLGSKAFSKGASVNGTLLLESAFGHVQFNALNNSWSFLTPPKTQNYVPYQKIESRDSLILFYAGGLHAYTYDGSALDSISIPETMRGFHNIYHFGEKVFIKDQDNKIFYRDGTDWVDISFTPFGMFDTEEGVPYFNFADNRWGIISYGQKVEPWTDVYFPDSSYYVIPVNSELLLYDLHGDSITWTTRCNYINSEIIPYEHGYLIASGDGIYYMDREELRCREFALSGNRVSDIFYHNDHIIAIVNGAAYTTDSTASLAPLPPIMNPPIFGTGVINNSSASTHSSATILNENSSMSMNSSIGITSSSAQSSTDEQHPLSSILSNVNISSDATAPITERSHTFGDAIRLIHPGQILPEIHEAIKIYTITGEQQSALPAKRTQVYIIVYQ